MTKTLGLVLCSLSLVACTTQQNGEKQIAGPVLQIAGVEIYNGLAYSIQDVSILVPSSGEYVSCGQVLPDSSCSTTFQVRDYRENPAQVHWTEHGEPQSTKPFTIKAPENATEGQEAYIRVEVFAPGQAGAKLLMMDTGIP